MILGLLAQPCLLVTYLGVRERVVVRTDWVGASPLTQLRSFGALLAESAALRRLVATVVFSGLSTTMLAKTILFVFEEFGQPQLGYTAAMAPAVALLVSVPLWVALGNRVGRVRTLILSLLMNLAATSATWLFSAYSPLNVVAFLCIVISSCGMSVMFWSLVPAVVADLERRREGGCAARVYALTTTARKLGQALAPLVISLSLGLGTDRSVLPGLFAAALLAAAIGVGYSPNERQQLSIN